MTLDGQMLTLQRLSKIQYQANTIMKVCLKTLTHEVVDIDFIHRDNFGHNVCRNYDEIKIGWKKLFLTRDQLIKIW